MRLTEREQQIISSTMHRIFPSAKILLFGSRVDNNAKGGDIDLLVESPLELTELFKKKLEATALLQQQLGIQRIDILLKNSRTPLSPVIEEALTKGVPL